MNRIVKCYHVNKWNLILYKYIVTNNFFPTSHLTTNNEQLSSLPKVHIVCSQIFEGQNWIILSLLCRQHYFKVIEVFLWYFESGLLNLWVLIVSVCVCSECQAGRWAASSRCVCVCWRNGGETVTEHGICQLFLLCKDVARGIIHRSVSCRGWECTVIVYRPFCPPLLPLYLLQACQLGLGVQDTYSGGRSKWKAELGQPFILSLTPSLFTPNILFPLCWDSVPPGSAFIVSFKAPWWLQTCLWIGLACVFLLTISKHTLHILRKIGSLNAANVLFKMLPMFPCWNDRETEGVMWGN